MTTSEFPPLPFDLRTDLAQRNAKWIFQHRNYSSDAIQKFKGAIASVDDGPGSSLVVSLADGPSQQFDATWLRHNCHCPACKTSSGQKSIDLSQLKKQFSIANSRVEDDEIHFDLLSGRENHSGWIPTSVIEDMETLPIVQPPAWMSRTVPHLAFDELGEAGHGAISKLLEIVSEKGLCLVSGLSIHEEALAQFTRGYVGPIQSTIYGEIFDVVSTETPTNVAYTNLGLPMHMDLVYYESPPGLQLLYCFKFDSCVDGGDNTFMDGLMVGEQMKREHPAEYQTLLTVPATFQKVHFQREDPVIMTYRRCHFTENREGQITTFTWAPPFEGTLLTSGLEESEAYYKAYSLLHDIISDPANHTRVRLHPGDVVVFNNRRILHGRDEFQSNGGSRHFRGCYVNIDEFKRSAHVAAAMQGKTIPNFNVFNGCQ